MRLLRVLRPWTTVVSCQLSVVISTFTAALAMLAILQRKDWTPPPLSRPIGDSPDIDQQQKPIVVTDPFHPPHTHAPPQHTLTPSLTHPHIPHTHPPTQVQHVKVDGEAAMLRLDQVGGWVGGWVGLR